MERLLCRSAFLICKLTFAVLESKKLYNLYKLAASLGYTIPQSMTPKRLTTNH